MGSTKQHERITCDDVKVGDRIARTRAATFHAVESIDEGPSTRRLHFAREACPEPPLLMAQEGSAAGRRYCPDCHRWENSGDSAKSLVNAGHGQTGGGNIRPRRTAKLWREVPARGSAVHDALAHGMTPAEQGQLAEDEAKAEDAAALAAEVERTD